MEEYQIPAVVRRVLKTSKLREVVEIISSRRDKLIDQFEGSPIFDPILIDSFKEQVKIKFTLLKFD